MEILVCSPFLHTLNNGDKVICLPLIVDCRNVMEVYTLDGDIIPELCKEDTKPSSLEEHELIPY